MKSSLKVMRDERAREKVEQEEEKAEREKQKAEREKEKVKHEKDKMMLAEWETCSQLSQGEQSSIPLIDTC